MAVRRKRKQRTITAGPVAQAQILDAAEDLFYLEGARNVGIDAVVKRAGVNKMSLYRQFESKEDLLRHYLLRRDKKFWVYIDASIDKHPGEPRAQLHQLFADLALRTSAANYRGCPFVNIAVEFPDRSHIARRMVADNKERLLKRLLELAKAAGAADASCLSKALALLIEGAYAASQTYGPGSSLMTALPKAAEVLIDAATEPGPATAGAASISGSGGSRR
ncbi:MAG TPA: TetR/AcrR family transcriptional regulator [Steroidobacteraceae bacterium]|jgi:AcrR family transcriptional regulator